MNNLCFSNNTVSEDFDIFVCLLKIIKFQLGAHFEHEMSRLNFFVKFPFDKNALFAGKIITVSLFCLFVVT